MDLELHWLPPFDLSDGSQEGLTYVIDRFDDIPETPGVYVFCRVFGESVCPLYIGKAADNLQKRFGQQLAGNVKLMNVIKNAPKGYRRVYIAEFIGKPGQVKKKAVAIIEQALITAALVEGFDLVNVQGTKTLVHVISSNGNKEARAWLPDSTIHVRHA